MNDVSLEKTLPCSPDSERAVLGAVLLEPKAIFAAAEVLNAEDFYLEGHRRIFQRCLDLAGEGKPVDPLTLVEELRRHDQLESAGGAAYVVSLTDGMPRAVNIRHYARTVREKATSRMLIALANDTMNRCYTAEETPAEILESHEAGIFKLAAREVRGGLEPVDPIVSEVYKDIEAASNRKSPVQGLETGLTELDRITCGLMPQELVIVAARPGLGKTSLCLNIAAHAAIRNGRKVAVFSLEMSKKAMVRRLLSSEGEVDASKIKSGYLNREDWGRLGSAASAISLAPIFMDESANMTPMQIHAKCERLQIEKGLDLAVVDYLQLLKGSSRRYDNRTQEVTEISRSLKMMAKELNIPVIAVSQLNREIERRAGGRRPQLSDLRESGAIEQDADLVLFLSREETACPSEDNSSSVVEITVAKQRDGATGEFKLGFLKQYTKFTNLYEPEQGNLYG